MNHVPVYVNYVTGYVMFLHGQDGFPCKNCRGYQVGLYKFTAFFGIRLCNKKFVTHLVVDSFFVEIHVILTQ